MPKMEAQTIRSTFMVVSLNVAGRRVAQVCYLRPFTAPVTGSAGLLPAALHSTGRRVAQVCYLRPFTAPADG